MSLWEPGIRPGPMISAKTETVDLSFRERALAEAARYGSDSWVFLRELLQNSRDAGARRVEFAVSQEEDVERIVCRDDGCGMSAEHAQRYLFSLYASSKEQNERQAGQFGVGFWSILRFKPERLVIRSRPSGTPGWQVKFDHQLGKSVFTPAAMKAGTEIILERRRCDQPLAERVFAAVHRYGRFVSVCQPGRFRRRRDEPLEITVNGRSANEEMTLPAPSSTFRRSGFRGVVALGKKPRVELYANGLFVRQVDCVEDLLDEGESDADESAPFLDLADSLAPHVILDSDELEVMLARGDVRQTRRLRLLVESAEKELDRLIERQLSAVRPQPWYLPLWTRTRGFLGRLRGPRVSLLTWWLVPAALVGALLGFSALHLTASTQGGLPLSARALARITATSEPSLSHYMDLGASYRGPRIDPLAAATARVALSYKPARPLFLTALAVENPSTWLAEPPQQPAPTGVYQGTSCQRDCVEIKLRTSGGDLRIPIPTGHRLDLATLRRNGDPHRAYATVGDEAIVLGLRQGDHLSYRTGPAPVPASYVPQGPEVEPPAVLQEIAARLSGLPHGERVWAAVEEVARRIAYDRSAQAVTEHYAERDAGRGFLESALAVGKGDCDIQNGVLVSLLRLVGVNARLAVGFVGHKGTAAPGLHAWVEYLDEERRFRIADVSTLSTPDGLQNSPLFWFTGADLSDVGAGSFLPDGALPAPDVGALNGHSAELSPAALEPTGHGSILVPGAVVLAAGLLVVLAFARRASPDRLQLSQTGDLAALLGGALQHPGLARLPALMHGRFIPLCGVERAISLAQAKRLAAAGELYASAGRPGLARDVAGRGLPVVDAATAEGRIVSLGLGAIDLDDWSRLLDRSSTSPLVDSLNRYLEKMDESWRLGNASPLGPALKLVDLARLGLGRRLVLIDPRHAEFAAAAADPDSRSAATAFRLLDTVAEHLDLEPGERARLLSDLARRAVMERATPDRAAGEPGA